MINPAPVEIDQIFVDSEHLPCAKFFFHPQVVTFLFMPVLRHFEDICFLRDIRAASSMRQRR